MKKIFVVLIILGVALFATNPKEEALYSKALKEEANMGDKWFSEAKYAMVSGFFDYENYYVIGVLRSKDSDEIKYIGFFNQVLKLP